MYGLLLVPLILGILVLLAGIFILFAPGKMQAVNEFTNKKLFNDANVFSYRVIFGIICLIVGVVLIGIYYQYM